jgi:NAD(P)H-hydrate epimerase
MKHIITGSEMKLIDKHTIQTIGIPSLVLMERAALSVADEIRNDFESSSKICCVCGVGNNGADGIAVSRILMNRGFETFIYIVGNKEKATEDFLKQLSVYNNVNGNIISDFESFKDNKFDLIVDAVFGVGLSRPVGGIFEEVIDYINDNYKAIYAVDIPSGIDADTGMKLSTAIRAAKTITFGCNKTGLLFNNGKDYAGQVIVADIGFPITLFDNSPNSYYSLEEADFSLIPVRKENSNKGSYGKILVVAGNDTMSGAAYICAKAALRMGCGMVKVFTTTHNEEYIRNNLPEAMITTYGTDNQTESVTEKLEEEIKWCDTVVAGPGIGLGELQNSIIRKILKKEGIKIVLDADAISNISDDESLRDILKSNKNQIVITPHIGEMSKFTGLSVSEIKNNHINVAKQFAGSYGITIIMKDSVTTVTDGNKVYINTSGNSGMATAGSGDVLAGITAAMVSKNMDFCIAGALAAYIHGIAGDLASEKTSPSYMIATDIIEQLADITKTIDRKNIKS